MRLKQEAAAAAKKKKLAQQEGGDGESSFFSMPSSASADGDGAGAGAAVEAGNVGDAGSAAWPDERAAAADGVQGYSGYASSGAVAAPVYGYGQSAMASAVDAAPAAAPPARVFGYGKAPVAVSAQPEGPSERPCVSVAFMVLPQSLRAPLLVAPHPSSYV